LRNITISEKTKQNNNVWILIDIILVRDPNVVCN